MTLRYQHFGGEVQMIFSKNYNGDPGRRSERFSTTSVVRMRIGGDVVVDSPPNTALVLKTPQHWCWKLSNTGAENSGQTKKSEDCALVLKLWL